MEDMYFCIFMISVPGFKIYYFPGEIRDIQIALPSVKQNLQFLAELKPYALVRETAGDLVSNEIR